MKTINSGDIFWVDLGLPTPQSGHEQAHKRPCVIIKPLPELLLAVIVPITSQYKANRHFSVVKIDCLNSTSFVLCHQIRTVSYNRLLNKEVELSETDFDKIITVLADFLEI